MSQHSELPVEPSIGELFLEIAADLRRIFQQACDELGLTYMQTTALRHAARHRDQARIVAEMGLAPTTVSALLGALERKGLLTRAKARGDHRQRVVELTAAGHRAIDRFDDQLARESPLIRNLDDDQYDTLRAILLAMRAPTVTSGDRHQT